MGASNTKFRFKDLYQFKGYKFCDSFVENNNILVVLKRTSKTGICPCCNKRCRYIHSRTKRKIRDLDVVDSKVYISFTSYQLDCNCGYNGYEELDFCEDYSRFTKRFEEKTVILCMKMCIKDVAKEMRIGWEATKRIDKKNAAKYVIDLEQVNPKRIGIDEIAHEKGHKYLTVVRDVDLGKVIWVGKNRRKETLDEFFKKLGIRKSWNIDVAVCDMWDPYIASIKANTNAAIVFDKFHIAKAITEAVDKVRKQEFAKADKEERINMKHKRFLILSRQKNLVSEKQEELRQLFDQNKNLFVAYLLKEQALDIFDEQRESVGLKRFKKWFKNVHDAGIEQFNEVAKRIDKYFYGIANYFIYRLTNAQSEGFNNKINIIKRRAYGFRDLEYFKLKILQSCGLKHPQNP
ncbi:MAG: ISL3 family transposase [Nanoarchaeota archaeon]|nr:ISL3 family transposase [Nanoarchaeota archaeon]